MLFMHVDYLNIFGDCRVNKTRYLNIPETIRGNFIISSFRPKRNDFTAMKTIIGLSTMASGLRAHLTPEARPASPKARHREQRGGGGGGGRGRSLLGVEFLDSKQLVWFDCLKASLKNKKEKQQQQHLTHTHTFIQLSLASLVLTPPLPSPPPPQNLLPREGRKSSDC